MVITDDIDVFVERYSQTDVKKTRTWSRKNLIETKKWIISKDTLNMLETKAKKEEYPHKHFRKLVYELPEYISYFGKVKSGNN